MKELFVVSASPHIRGKGSIDRAMKLVILALMPAFAFSVYLFGIRALLITLVSIIVCLLSEAVMQKLLGKNITITDGSALLTGLLLSFNLPPGVPLWLPAVGSIFAIVFAKQLFGGLGYNFINPALAGRAFLMASWPSLMTKEWLAPTGGSISGIDGVTSATPLTLLKNPANFGSPEVIIKQLNDITTIKNLFIGKVGGCIGETSALFLLVGGIFLLIIGIIDYRIVAGYLGSFFLLALVLPTKANIFFHLFSGGLFLGAFFMATDWVTSPVTKKGRWIFGVGCGVLTVIIRIWGGYPEGVSYSILLMNVFTPVIDRFTREKVFGTLRSKKEAVK
ncbi:MAG TPA: RnfABCDGE type electron transport complex subunit D [candidate division WOR-3 bacterium]|uniref:Ion-translocating oxidoreductase complex subunit D n=1 Tax=candidate division WOR-3 bacterium TaxID=2052148 RepID=A0A9C9ENM8_UNCW3|nr:RnfABCDGE type electron transport complex subunit D [candidate division WOR-3 bacterium]